MNQRLFANFTTMLALLAVAFAAFVTAWDHARADDTVPTEASVSSTAVAPHIECKWELPDMDSSLAGIQYNNDDRPNQFPSVDPACDFTTGSATPQQPDGVRHMTQVAPNPEDLPEERRIQLWMAVDHPNGVSNISDVYWKVFHPDGTPKVQVHGTRVPVAECEAYGAGASGPTTMFGSAVATHQISSNAISDINNGIVTKCKQNEKALYYAEFLLSKHQACGEYKIEAHAVSSGNEDVLVNYLDVLCVYFLEIDFDTANYGTITPGLSKVLSGDFLFQPPSSSQPTVKNVGNSGMGLSIHFSKMVQQGTTLPKEIDQFDACFARLREDNTYSLSCIDPIFASQTLSFGDERDHVLCSNEVGKLDLSIHPPSTLPGGTYKGTVDIIARSVMICPTDQSELIPGS